MSFYGRGGRLGRGLGVGAHLPAHGVAVCVAVGVTLAVAVAVAVGVAVGVGLGAPNCAQYLAPVWVRLKPPTNCPPQTIISLPLHIAV